MITKQRKKKEEINREEKDRTNKKKERDNYRKRFTVSSYETLRNVLFIIVLYIYYISCDFINKTLTFSKSNH